MAYAVVIFMGFLIAITFISALYFMHKKDLLVLQVIETLKAQSLVEKVQIDKLREFDAAAATLPRPTPKSFEEKLDMAGFKYNEVDRVVKDHFGEEWEVLT